MPDGSTIFGWDFPSSWGLGSVRAMPNGAFGASAGLCCAVPVIVSVHFGMMPPLHDRWYMRDGHV